MRWLCLIVALLTLLALPPALAVEPDEILSDPALEARARTLSKCAAWCAKTNRSMIWRRRSRAIIAGSRRGDEAN
jgi:cytochrome c-type biogenesis protein CcmH/NrfF